MSIFLVIAFLFCIGSIIGWCIELLFRRFFDKKMNPDGKWVNPGYCVGPYLPIYGCGLVMLYLIASFEKLDLIENPYIEKPVLFFIMALCMTAVEFVAGTLSLMVTSVRLWDYSDEWGNIKGIICPKFSLFWAILGAVYYFLIHPYILDALEWLSKNLAFSFFVGLFFGIFIIDVAYSSSVMAKLKKFAEENDVYVKYEKIKSQFRAYQDKQKRRLRFFFPFRSERSISDVLTDLKITFERRKK
ncbi:MAG: putative ABC transporter permease [Ruminococcus sp.]|nr:putative ABC transporter permease [Ruminococcus sp.]